MLEFFNRLLNNEKGFTLIEVLVVVAIIGILIAFAAPRVLTRLEDARVASDESVAKVLNDAIVTIELDNAVNPRGTTWTTGDITRELKEYLEDTTAVTGAAVGDAVNKDGGLVLTGKSSKKIIKAHAPNTGVNTSDVWKFFVIDKPVPAT